MHLQAKPGHAHLGHVGARDRTPLPIRRSDARWRLAFQLAAPRSCEFAELMQNKGFAPAADRNRGPILEVLRRVLPKEGRVLEIASGTGQHARFFAESLPTLHWQPSDVSDDALGSIRAWVEDQPLPNLALPLLLDVSQQPWPLRELDAVLCINMIHISPWASTQALFRGAEDSLKDEGTLITYGPYQVAGVHTAPSNAAFDEGLRTRNPSWGVRDLDELRTLASEHGFTLAERVPMPANNMTLIWARHRAS